MPNVQPEAFSHILIDRALSDSNLDLLDSRQVQFEYKPSKILEEIIGQEKAIADKAEG